MKKSSLSLSSMKAALLASFLMLLWTAVPARADTTCPYDFTTGSGHTYLSYCVTANGTILLIETPKFVGNFIAVGGEGYGICDQNAPAAYWDYGLNNNTGNWQNAVLISHTSTSVKIARTTNDGKWTLTQTITITQVPQAHSITIAMALKNNQAVSDVAYLVRFADAELGDSSIIWAGFYNSALTMSTETGLQLSNVGVPQFSFWQGYAQDVSTGPNACAFAFNEAPGNFMNGPSGSGSIEMAYVGIVAAGQTRTATVSYHAL